MRMSIGSGENYQIGDRSLDWESNGLGETFRDWSPLATRRVEVAKACSLEELVWIGQKWPEHYYAELLGRTNWQSENCAN